MTHNQDVHRTFPGHRLFRTGPALLALRRASHTHTHTHTRTHTHTHTHNTHTHTHMGELHICTYRKRESEMQIDITCI